MNDYKHHGGGLISYKGNFITPDRIVSILNHMAMEMEADDRNAQIFIDALHECSSWNDVRDTDNYPELGDRILTAWPIGMDIGYVVQVGCEGFDDYMEVCSDAVHICTSNYWDTNDITHWKKLPELPVRIEITND